MEPLRATCTCCACRVVGEVWAVAMPGERRPTILCKRCAPHCALKADGTIYRPRPCPEAPRPRLRVLHAGT